MDDLNLEITLAVTTMVPSPHKPDELNLPSPINLNNNYNVYDDQAEDSRKYLNNVLFE